ncbi:hypothetical protein P7C70_g2311, partial [Phenoliferia sp. Uapishka_3]
MLPRSLRLIQLRPTSSTSRQLSTRPHPLANRITPRGPVPASQKQPPRKPAQRVPVISAILLATITGTATYVLGLRAAGADAVGEGEGGEKRTYRDPTQEDFNKAMEEIRELLPQDNWSQDKETLLAYGLNEWSYHDLSGLPGAVLMPRSTEDVSRIVKIAAKHSIPIIPYSGGTSLEGTHPPLTTSIRGPRNDLPPQATVRPQSTPRTPPNPPNSPSSPPAKNSP